MRRYAPLALVGVLLVVSQPLLRAQYSKAEQEKAIAEIKKLGGKVEVDPKSPGMPVVGVNLKHTKIVDASSGTPQRLDQARNTLPQGYRSHR